MDFCFPSYAFGRDDNLIDAKGFKEKKNISHKIKNVCANTEYLFLCQTQLGTLNQWPWWNGLPIIFQIGWWRWGSILWPEILIKPEQRFWNRIWLHLKTLIGRTWKLTFCIMKFYNKTLRRRYTVLLTNSHPLTHGAWQYGPNIIEVSQTASLSILPF